MSNGFRRGRQSGQRRRTSWELGPGSCTEANITGVGSFFLGDAISPTLDGLTLARIRGRLSFLLTSVSAAGSGFCGAFGIGIATAAAVTAGAASLPTPITEQAWDGWLFWMPIQLLGVTATIADGVNAAAVYQEMVVDTKAMRKMNIEDAVYAIVELEVEEDTAVMEARFDSRGLFFLP